MKTKTLGILILITTLFSVIAQDQNKKELQKPQDKQKTEIQSQQNSDIKDQIPISDSIKIPVLDFKNTDIRDILRALGMQYNVNIYLEPDVEGTISLYLTNISMKDAIDFIVKRKGFEYRVENNIVKVFKPAPPPKPKPPKAKVVFHAKENLLTVDFKELPVGDVIRMFIDSIGLNVVLDGSSDKKLSSRLSNIKIEKAIKVIFESNGFEINTSDDIYYVSQPSWSSDGKSTGGRKSLGRMSVKVTKDKKVSLEVNNASIDDLVRSIAAESGLNIVVYENITGNISAKCDTTYIDDILRFLLQNTKFTFWKDKGIYFIGSREMSQQKTTEVIELKHIRAEEQLISKYLPPKISKEAVIKYDSEHNAVIVIGSYDIVAEATEFIEKIDRPIPQVLIEALVVEFNLNKIRSYGVSVFTGGLSDTSGEWDNEQFLPSLDLKPGRKRITNILNDVLRHLGAKRVVELPKNFRVSIQALEAADVVKVHSTPQIATINGNPASITIGETRYYKLSKETISATSNVNQNLIGTDERFVEKKFNTQLEVTPWVMADGYVMVEIRPEFNIPRSGGDSDRPPTIDTRVIKSMVRIRDGQTIVLGGQRQTENVVNSKGVPLLSSIPILGYIFSSRTITKNETQMMIFLTPHVYYGDEGEVSPDDYFGDEITKMLEKHDPELKREKQKEKREKRRIKRSRKRGDGKFLWFKKKDKKEIEIKDQSTKKSEKEEKNKRDGFLWFKKKEKQETNDKDQRSKKKEKEEKKIEEKGGKEKKKDKSQKAKEKEAIKKENVDDAIDG